MLNQDNGVTLENISHNTLRKWPVGRTLANGLEPIFVHTLAGGTSEVCVRRSEIRGGAERRDDGRVVQGRISGPQ